MYMYIYIYINVWEKYVISFFLRKSETQLKGNYKSKTSQVVVISKEVLSSTLFSFYTMLEKNIIDICGIWNKLKCEVVRVNKEFWVQLIVLIQDILYYDILCLLELTF